MFNMRGEVIGINTAIFSPSGGYIGIGFAIPSTVAQRHRRTSGVRPDPARLAGRRISRVTPEIAESLGLRRGDRRPGREVTPGGPAADAGIQAGDVILTFGGKEVNEMRRLPRVVAETGVEQKVPVKLWRRGGQGADGPGHGRRA